MTPHSNPKWDYHDHPQHSQKLASMRLQFLLNHFQTSHVSSGWWEEEPWVTGSKVKVNFGTICTRPCGHDSDYSFCLITFKLHMQVVDDERRNPIDCGSRGQRSRSTLDLCIRPCGHDSDYSFCPITFQSSHVICGWWEEEHYWFLVTRSMVKVNFGTLFIRPCGHNSDNSFALSLSNFACKLWMMRGETLLILCHGVKGQRSILALCIRPCRHNTAYSLYPITFKLHM